MFDEFDEYEAKLCGLYQEWSEELELEPSYVKRRRINKKYEQLIEDLVYCFKVGRYNKK